MMTIFGHRDFKTFSQDYDPDPSQLEEADAPERTPDDHELPPEHSFRYTCDSIFVKRFLPEVLGIVGLCLVGYALTWGLQGLAQTVHSDALQKTADFIFNGGAMSGAFFHGEIWRPLTSAFLHGGMFHIVGNMLSLVGLAFVLRRYAPRRRWLYIFLFTQYVGCIIAGYLNPGLMVGASVGIMGLLGALFASLIRMRWFKANEQPGELPITIGTLLTGIGLQIVMESMIPNVGHAAHAAGFALGFAIGLLIALRGATNIYVIGKHTYVRSASFTDKSPVAVESITFDSLPGFDKENEVVYVVDKVHTFWGAHRAEYRVLYGSRSHMLKHRGAGRLVATRFSVPSFKNGVAIMKKLQEVLDKRAAAKKLPLVQSLLAKAMACVPAGAAWYYMFHEWLGDMRMDPAKLQWINDYAPAAIAPYAIDLLSVGGCAMMTFFLAQIVYTIANSYTSGFVKGLSKKSAPAES